MAACRGALAGALGLGLLSVGLPSLAGPESALPPKFQRAPYAVMSLTVGHPNAGRQLRAKRLRPSKYLRIKAGSEAQSYGHPALVLMLGRSARELWRASPGSVMLVGDLSAKHGGPLTGHRSHQSGRDADVGFYALDPKGKPFTPTALVAFGPDGKARDGSGLVFDDRRNWLLVDSWARDERAGLSHVFLARHLKQRLLAHALAHGASAERVTQAAALLKQPEDSSPHDDHFHVRVSCPKRQLEICREESR